MKPSVQISFYLFLLSFSWGASAAEDPFLDKFHLWVGGDGGYSRIVPGRAGELTKNGYQVGPSGFASYSWSRMTAELGGGWFYNVSEGDAATGAVLSDKITTKAGFGHVVARVRLTPEWEIGLANRILFGADARFQSTATAENHVHWLMGVQGVYRLATRFPLQISGTFLTDMTISGRQVYQALVGIHVGFDIFNFGSDERFAPARTKEVQKVKVESTTEKTDVVMVPVPVPAPEPKRTYILDLQTIQFDFDSAQLRPQAKEMLEELGAFLASFSETWDHLTIEGHTDHIGSYEYNLDLSQRRAESVRNALLAKGVRSDAVLAKGLSFSEPLVPGKTDLDRQKNRRVEFEFEGIHDPEKLDEYFNRINARY